MRMVLPIVLGHIYILPRQCSTQLSSHCSKLAATMAMAVYPKFCYRKIMLAVCCLLFFSHLTLSVPVDAIEKKAVDFVIGADGQLSAAAASCATEEAYPAWFHASGTFDEGDCSSALELFYNDFVKHNKGTRYEFLSSGIEPVHEGIPDQRLPLKIGSGKWSFVPSKASDGSSRLIHGSR